MWSSLLARASKWSKTTSSPHSPRQPSPQTLLWLLNRRRPTPLVDATSMAVISVLPTLSMRKITIATATQVISRNDLPKGQQSPQQTAPTPICRVDPLPKESTSSSASHMLSHKSDDLGSTIQTASNSPMHPSQILSNKATRFCPVRQCKGPKILKTHLNRRITIRVTLLLRPSAIVYQVALKAALIVCRSSITGLRIVEVSRVHLLVFNLLNN